MKSEEDEFLENIAFQTVEYQNKSIIDDLYELLKKRDVHSISHRSMPSKEDHYNFVRNRAVGKFNSFLYFETVLLEII